jgi:Fe2+ or Zn2+ uptake regulation protein
MTTVTVRDVDAALREHGIQPSAQRLVVADFVLRTDEHPTAEQVFERVKSRLPMISRATVYNTLNLFVEKGLLRELVLGRSKDGERRVVFDPNLDAHHHFIDDATGAIHDVPWEAVKVSKVDRLEGFDVREYQVVMRGRARRPARR